MLVAFSIAFGLEHLKEHKKMEAMYKHNPTKVITTEKIRSGIYAVFDDNHPIGFIVAGDKMPGTPERQGFAISVYIGGQMLRHAVRLVVGDDFDSLADTAVAALVEWLEEKRNVIKDKNTEDENMKNTNSAKGNWGSSDAVNTYDEKLPCRSVGVLESRIADLAAALERQEALIDSTATAVFGLRPKEMDCGDKSGDGQPPVFAVLHDITLRIVGNNKRIEELRDALRDQVGDGLRLV